jgi:hypothetical protein
MLILLASSRTLNLFEMPIVREISKWKACSREHWGRNFRTDLTVRLCVRFVRFCEVRALWWQGNKSIFYCLYFCTYAYNDVLFYVPISVCILRSLLHEKKSFYGIRYSLSCSRYSPRFVLADGSLPYDTDTASEHVLNRLVPFHTLARNFIIYTIYMYIYTVYIYILSFTLTPLKCSFCFLLISEHAVLRWWVDKHYCTRRLWFDQTKYPSGADPGGCAV